MKRNTAVLSSIVKSPISSKREHPEILNETIKNLRKPKKREVLRRLNSKELMDLMLLMVAAQIVLDNIQKLEYTTVYRQTVKHKSKAFIEALEELTTSEMWSGQDDETNYRSHNAITEMAKITENIINIMAKGKEKIHPGQQPLFWREVNLLAKKYEMPVKFSPTGDLI